MKITKEFIEKIPKSELHVHLDGSLRIKTLIDLAKKVKVKLPSYDESGLKELVFKENYPDLNAYLQGFFYTVAVMKNKEALELTAYELAEDCAAEGIRYLEVRFAPQLHMRVDLSFEDTVMAVHKGLERFQKQFNGQRHIINGDEPEFHYGIICCAMRKFDGNYSEYFKHFYDVHRFTEEAQLMGYASRELALAAVKARDVLGIPIVGIDLAGSEFGYPAGDHIAAYQIAQKHFLKKTVHAGEAYGPESIFQAITDLYADRIGHGYHLYDQQKIDRTRIANPEKYVQELAQYIADRRITIEVCLTSNRQTLPNITSWQEHSFGRFLKAGLSVSLCTDNRTVSSTTLSDEIHLAVKEFGLTAKQLKNIVIYGFKRSFFPNSYQCKRNYVRQIINYYEKIEKEYKINSEG